MQSPTALKKYGADKGPVDENGVFQPTGTYGIQHPTGTGPFKFELVDGRRQARARRATTNYWGTKAKLGRLIFRPIRDNTARLQALQTGEIKGYDLVAPAGRHRRSRGNTQAEVLNRPAFNVAYVDDQPGEAADEQQARCARRWPTASTAAVVVNAFYAGRGEVAKEFHAAAALSATRRSVKKYPYNPEKAKALLQQAGLTMPVKVDFWYPTGVSRPYMPDPKRNFEAFAASLEKSGFKVVPHSAPWRPDYVGRSTAGTAGDLNLIGWTGDYGDPDNFVGVFFQSRPAAVRLPEQRDLQHRCNKASTRDRLRPARRALPAGEQHDHEATCPGSAVRAHEPGARRSRRRSRATSPARFRSSRSPRVGRGTRKIRSSGRRTTT